jgi:hypothetical protein
MRGVYTSTYLGELADAFARKRRVAALDVGKGFDLIAGTSSVTDQRESGLPESRGSVQANAVTCARTAEG